MMWLPFICLGLGFFIGLRSFSVQIAKLVDICGNIALITLMFTIGVNIGTDDTVISNVGVIGFQCVVISLFALFASVLCIVIFEKTFLPLDRFKNVILDKQLSADPPNIKNGSANIKDTPASTNHMSADMKDTTAATNHMPADIKDTTAATNHMPVDMKHTPAATNHTPVDMKHTPAATNHTPVDMKHTPAATNQESPEKKSSLVWIIPASIIFGVVIGYFIIPLSVIPAINMVFTASLAVLYISVGIGISQNKTVLQYVKVLGWKVTLLPVAILVGSIAGGIAASFVLGIEPYISILSASGMSYYSITGAFLTQTYGIHIGAYGFLVNVFREFFTVLMLPLLIKISKGSPIAAGASGNMDTMLVPVTKFVGTELGFVALMTGTILTIVVPMLLPILSQILS